MGICSNIIKPAHPDPNALTIHAYPRKCTINVKNLKKASTDPYNFILTDPIQLKSEEIIIESLTLSVSQCILPGIDPRGQYFKKCQDNCLVLSTPTTLFVALFDGHGSDGSKIVNFCSIFSEKFFHSHWQEPYSPSSFLSLLCESCDKDLLTLETRINSSASGTTAIFMLIHSGTIYTASLGDSRGVLGSRRQVPRLVPFIPRIEDELIFKLNQKRQCPQDETLLQVQLTRDLKPEDPEEYNRIIEAGGRIKRLIDEDGNKVGPFRVWETEGNYPGLTMTRSIGDKGAKGIGLISTPIITELEIDKRNDLFIVIASDGIWHCMENLDVINFVQFFRPLTCRQIVKHRDEDVNFSNSCIAQLLCEEARARWLMVVEEEDVEIDDIGCIVIEIQGKSAFKSERKSKTVKLGEMKIEKNKRENVVLNPDKRSRGRTPTVKKTKIRDPKRGSHVRSESKGSGEFKY